MLEFFYDFGLFFLKTFTVSACIIIVCGSILALSIRSKRTQKEEMAVEKLNDRYLELKDSIMEEVLDAHDWKKYVKAQKEEQKEEEKKHKKKEVETSEKKRLYVLDFKGDVHAEGVDLLSEEITAVLSVVRPIDEVLLRLESPGGVVHGYGLAASQLHRLRKKNIHLTVAVDKVAASGGYLMACVADRIIAAPFAVLGSVGVVAQLLNFNRVLKKYDVEVELHTAGQFKRTLTPLGENTDEARQKFKEELEDIHVLFKDYVHEHRAIVDIEKIATGEHWFGRRALELKLIDEILTSDEYLMSVSETADIFLVKIERKKSLAQKMLGDFQGFLQKTFFTQNVP
jgi:serine protease SohB